MAIERGDDQFSQNVVAGNRYLLAGQGQDLDSFQEDQFGPELNAHQHRNLHGYEGLCHFVERAVSEATQNGALMANVGCLVVLVHN